MFALALLLQFTVCDGNDHRMDPFEFNLCLWDLQGIEQGKVEENTNKVGKTMASLLSTCDMYVLPGLKDANVTKRIMDKMESMSYKNFKAYDEHNSQMTIVSRLYPEHTESVTGSLDFPLPESKCPSNTTLAGTVDLSTSFSVDVEFHEPVRKTRVVAVDFSTRTCQEREAQAKLLCNYVSEVKDSKDVFVTGFFGADIDEPYHEILKQCGLKYADMWTVKDPYTVKDKKKLHRIYATEGISKRFDIVKIWQTSDATKLDGIENYPFELFVHQPLTPKWKAFEIAFSFSIVIASVGFFILLIYCSRLTPSSGGYSQI